ncbi:MAG: hypothetical protein JXN65_10040 [Clostridia bacterium]|nr:hypothetical protein [Clostridia bacterium]
MKNTKLNLLNICILLAAVSLLCALLAMLIGTSYAYPEDTEKLDYSKKSYAQISLSYINEEKQRSHKLNDFSYLMAYKNEYIYNDIHFLTSCEDWDATLMSSAAIELFSNSHGDEIKYVEAVIFEQGSGIHYGSNYESIYDPNEIPLYIFGFLPEDSCFYDTYEKGILYIYNVDSKTTARDIAQAMSTAYGYHYTHYYFGLNGNNKDKDTDYYKLRSAGSSELKVDFIDNADYLENNNWFLYKVAANDYMYLMGSKNARRTEKFGKFGKGTMLFDGVYEALQHNFRYCLNATPHSNVCIEMPHRVDGLADYFYSFIDVDTPEFTVHEPIGDLNMRVKADSRMKNIEVYWDTPYKDSNVIYTLVAYDSSNEIVSIVNTIDGTQEGHGKFTEKYEFGIFADYARREYYYMTQSFKEDNIRIFRVLITFPDKTVEVSDPLILN